LGGDSFGRIDTLIDLDSFWISGTLFGPNSFSPCGTFSLGDSLVYADTFASHD